MLPQDHLEKMERGLSHQRRQQQGGSPCPRGNGTTVGTFQPFTVLCNTNFEGEGTVLDRFDAFDFVACMDICSSFHPRCDGASYDGSRCALLSRVQANGGNSFTRFSRNVDSGLASFPEATSNCPMLGTQQRILDTTTFNIMCGLVIAGGDISQNFAPTFQDCLGQCAATSGCAAVSFDPSQELGFKNCYLKTGLGESGNLLADRRTDSATVVPDDPAPPQTPPGPGVATIPVPSPSPATGNGVVFFTPPGGIASASSTSIAIPPPAPTTTTPLVLDIPSDIPATLSSSVDVPPFLFPGTITGSPMPETAGPETVAEDLEVDGTSSNAWIAAPVVGSVAAIALIVISFIMLKRRRRSSSFDRREKPIISRPSPISGFFTSLIPIAYRKSTASSSSASSTERKSRKLGNFSEATRAERDNSVRNSVAGFLTGRLAGMERLEDIEEGTGTSQNTPRGNKEMGETPVYEIKNGRAELRNSLNGLSQNRWS